IASKGNHKNIEKMHWHLLSRLFAPESVLVDEDYNVIHATAGINQYLGYKGGEPSRNILEMANADLRQSLRSILFKLGQAEASAEKQTLKVRLDGKDLEITGRSFQEEHYEEELIHV